MKIGIISMAHVHAPGYAEILARLPDVALYGIADDDPIRGSNAAATYGCTWFRDYQDLLNSDVDAVVICTPNAQHVEPTCAAAAAGKHVLCEKPLAATTADARRMIAACDAAGVQLQTAFPMRFKPPMVQAREVLRAGRLGDLLAVNATNQGTMPPGWFLDPRLSGGGAAMDHTVHVADLVRWFTGREVVEVYAEVDTLLHDVEVDDCALLTFTLDNDVFVSLDASWSRPGTSYPTWGGLTMHLVGTNGILRADGFSQVGTVYSEHLGKGVYQDWGTNADLGMVQSFIDSIRADQPSPGATGEDGLRALQVALGAYHSAASGQPVSLSVNE